MKESNFKPLIILTSLGLAARRKRITELDHNLDLELNKNL